MESHCISLFLVPDVKEMGAESLCYGVFGLSYTYCVLQVLQVMQSTKSIIIIKISLLQWCNRQLHTATVVTALRLQ